MIITVRGEIEKKDFGLACSHEHLLIDMSKLIAEPSVEDNPNFNDKLCVGNRYRVFCDPYALKDNAIIDEFDTALSELKLFYSAGGRGMVDATTDEIGRDPLKLLKLSELSGVNICMGCGNYYDASLSQATKESEIDALYTAIMNDIQKGVRATGVRAGLIGEIGTSRVITQSEKKSLRAAARASKESGLSVHVHTSLYEENGYEVIKIMCEEGAKEEKICIDHIDVKLREDYLLRLLDRGVYVEFDNFGKEFYIPKRAGGLITERFEYDLARVEMVVKLIKKGYINQLLLSNDICLKSMLCAYGGNGYAHIFTCVKSMLLDAGLTQKDLQKLFVSNVADFLDVTR